MESLSEGDGAIRDSLSARVAAFALAARKNAGKPADSKRSYFADYDPTRGGWFVNNIDILV